MLWAGVLCRSYYFYLSLSQGAHFAVTATHARQRRAQTELFGCQVCWAVVETGIQKWRVHLWLGRNRSCRRRIIHFGMYLKRDEEGENNPYPFQRFQRYTQVDDESVRVENCKADLL
jgi:hypothetical protein